MGGLMPGVTAAVQAPALEMMKNSGHVGGTSDYAATSSNGLVQILYELMSLVQSDGQANRETVTLLGQILQAVNQIDPTMVMDGTTLARTSNSYFEAEQQRRGPSLVKVV